MAGCVAVHTTAKEAFASETKPRSTGAHVAWGMSADANNSGGSRN